MLISAGLGFIAIGVLNIIKIAFDVIKHTPNALEDDVDVVTIMMNFTQNTSQEHQEFLEKLHKSNILFFTTGTILITMGLFL